jgi:hypothetical protein
VTTGRTFIRRTLTIEEGRRQTRQWLAEANANGDIPWGPDTTITRDVAVATVADLQAAVNRAREGGKPTPSDLRGRVLPMQTLILETLPELHGLWDHEDPLFADLERLVAPVQAEIIAEVNAAHPDNMGLIVIRFGGGPWDGHERVDVNPPRTWFNGFAVTGGRYRLRSAKPPGSAAHGTRTFYEWMPEEETGADDQR